MTRRWYNEDFRKLYTRQDGPWLSLPAAARALASDLVRYADQEGVVAMIGKGETAGDAIAGVIRAKSNEREWVNDAVAALLDDQYLIRKGSRIIIRNFVDAQERLSQEAARKRRQRDKETDNAGNWRDNGGTNSGTTAGQERDNRRDIGGTSDAECPTDVTTNVTQKFAVSRRDETRRDEEKHCAPRGARQGVDFDFEAVYRLYPNKRGKAKGMKLCRSRIKTAVDFEHLRGAVENYAADCNGKDRQYVKHFSTFMGEWEDWIKPPVDAPAANGRSAMPDASPSLPVGARTAMEDASPSVLERLAHIRAEAAERERERAEAERRGDA